MTEPIWIGRRTIELLHDESLAEHGGLAGLRDENMLESALARPRNKYAYEQTEDVAKLAAAYAFGLAKNHPFVDGNKRIAFIAAALNVRMNGLRLKADQVDAYNATLRLAAGELSEDEFADWIRANIRPK